MKCNVSKGLLMTALICGMCSGGGTAVFAEENLTEYTLDQMVVTATRTEMKELDVPASVEVITAEDMVKNGSTTVYEALQKTIGFTNGTTYSADGDDIGSSTSRLSLRGFDKGCLVLINGAPANVLNSPTLSGIPVDTIEKIEVVKGASSALYGAEAQAGVINIITKKGGENKTTITVGGGNFLRKWNVTTQGEGYIVSVGRDYKHEFKDANNGDYYTSTGTSQQTKRRYISKYTRDNVFASGKVGKDLTLTYSGSFANPLQTSTNPGTSVVPKNEKQYKYDDAKQTFSLVYDNKESGLKSTLSYSEKRVESTTIQDGVVSSYVHKDASAPNKSGTYNGSSNYKTGTLYFDTQKKFTFGDDSLIVGVDYKHENYDLKYGPVLYLSKWDSKGVKTYYNYQDHDRNAYGLFASYNKKFSDKFNMIAGIRGQYYAAMDCEDSHSILLPQLQTNYKIDEQTAWYTNIGKSFMAPAVNSANSRTSTDPNVWGKNEVKPQEGWTYETGLKRITDTSSSRLAVFYMDFKDKLEWTTDKYIDASGIEQSQSKQINTGKYENLGIEFQYNKVLGSRWGYNFGAAYQDPVSTAKDGTKSQADDRLQFNCGLDYNLSKFSANVTCAYVGERQPSYYYNLPKGDPNRGHDRLEDKIDLSAYFNYKADKNSSFRLNLNNILDRRDTVSKYEYRVLPFNWMLTYQYTF